jgi:hypothetical protein
VLVLSLLTRLVVWLALALNPLSAWRSPGWRRVCSILPTPSTPSTPSTLARCVRRGVDSGAHGALGWQPDVQALVEDHQGGQFGERGRWPAPPKKPPP